MVRGFDSCFFQFSAQNLTNVGQFSQLFHGFCFLSKLENFGVQSVFNKLKYLTSLKHERGAKMSSAFVPEPSTFVADLAVCVAEPSIFVGELAVCVAGPSIFVADLAVCVAEPSIFVAELAVYVAGPSISVVELAVCVPGLSTFVLWLAVFVAELSRCVAEVPAGVEGVVVSGKN